MPILLFGGGSAGGNGVLARITPGHTFARYVAIQLWPTPNAAITYHVDYVRLIPDLINATDEPLVPEDFHWLLVEGALMKEWSKKDDTRHAECKADFDDGVKALRSWLVTNPDTVATLRRPAALSFSTLGPMYPKGS